jgi:hypothetical protein
VNGENCLITTSSVGRKARKVSESGICVPQLPTQLQEPEEKHQHSNFDLDIG